MIHQLGVDAWTFGSIEPSGLLNTFGDLPESWVGFLDFQAAGVVWNSEVDSDGCVWKHRVKLESR